MSSFAWSEGTSRYDNAGKWPSPWKELSEPVSTFWQPNQQVERNSGFNFSIANQSSLQQETRFLIKTSGTGRFFFAFFSLSAAPPRSSGCRRTSRWAVWLFRARVGLMTWENLAFGLRTHYFLLHRKSCLCSFWLSSLIGPSRKLSPGFLNLHSSGSALRLGLA